MSKQLDYAIAFVKKSLGAAQDNLHRAKMRFAGYTPEALALQHGESGRTRQQILDAYQEDFDHWTAELKELNG